MSDRRLRLGLLVGFVASLCALPRAGQARMTFVQEEGIEDGHIEYDFIGDVVMSPDDRFLYATTAYTPNEVVVYEVAPLTGKIEEIGFVDPPTFEATILAMAPGGAQLYVLDYVSGQISVYARNATTGLLTYLQTVQPPTSGINQQWQGMTVSPDGAHVYTTSAGLNAVGVWGRDGATGLLTFIGLDSGMPGLSRPIGIAVSPDGAHVYIGCYRLDGGIVVLARDASTGHLSGVQHFENGDIGVLQLQFSVAVAPDGAYVYFSGSAGIRVFARDPSTGKLTLRQTTVDGSDHEVVLSADGSRAYACGSLLGIRGYARDALSGILTEVEHHLPGEEGFAPPAFCFGMTMSSDARHFYTLNSYDLDLPSRPYAYTLGVFRLLNYACTPAPRTDCRAPLAPGRSSVKIRSGRFNRLSWKLRGPGSAADFGDPVDGVTEAALCAYDDRGSALGAFAPGSAPCPGDHSCWRRRAPLDVRYTSKETNRDGVKLVKLQQRGTNEVRLDVEGRGGSLVVPTLPMQGTVTVQLVLSDGTSASCWSASYSSPSSNSVDQYRANADP
jgi:DNA-binding beta-propeller fold protein YncE